MNTPPLLLSKKEAGRVLGISNRSVEYLISNKQLPTRRVGRRVLIPFSACERFARADHPEPLAGAVAGAEVEA